MNGNGGVAPRYDREVSSMRHARKAGFFLIALAIAPLASGQFGKNKIAYDDFNWKVYESEHFQFFYYPEEERFLPKISGIAEHAYAELSKSFKHDIKSKIPLIFYKTHGEFEETNIELNFLPESIGAFAEPSRNRMVIPIDNPDETQRALITHELTHIFEYDILFASDFGRILRARPPLWLMEGLASHMAHDEDTIDVMVIRDAVVTEKVPDIFDQTQLSFLTYRFGQAAFDFIESKWGMDGIRELMAEYRNNISAKVEKAIEEAFKMKPDEFNDAFKKYLRDKYLPYVVEKDDPSDYGKEIGLKGPYIQTLSPAVSPSGELIAVLTNKYGDEIDLVLISAKDGTVFKNLTRGFTNRYEYIVLKSFSGKRDVTWSQSGDEIAFFGRKENKKLLFIIDATNGHVEEKEDVEVDEVQSPAFSPDGKRVLFAGNKGGIVDIFYYDRGADHVENVTKDDNYDSNPMWFPDGKSIIYTSKVGAWDKIFVYDLGSGTRRQITFGPWNDIEPIVALDGKTVYFSTDESGIFNLASLQMGGQEIRQYTDVVGGNFSPIPLAAKEGKSRLAFSSFFEGRMRLYEMELGEPIRVARIDPKAGEEAIKTAEVKSLDIKEEDKKTYGDIGLGKKFHIDTLYVEGGIADDGTILSNSVVGLSDLLGNQRIVFQLQSVDSFSNFDTFYLNIRHRLNWGVRLYDQRDFFYVPDQSTGTTNFSRRRVRRESGALGFVSYPLDKFHRVEAGVGYIDRTIDYGAFGLDIIDNSLIDENGVLKDNYPYVTTSFVGDSTRFKEFGPYHGRRYDLTMRYAPNALGSSRGFFDTTLDFRNYTKVTARSLVALRFFGAVSQSDTPNLYSFGGSDTLRGFDFRELVGSRAAFANAELRFPFVDELRFGFGLALRQLRGKVFLDTGLAYFDRDNIDLWSREGGFHLVDLKAAVGVGFGFDLGPFELQWTFARRTDFQNWDDKTRTAFYIGRSF
ncbi:MAG: hypothetical protein U0166_26860 [Acidobacteriota bacterium]